MEDKKQEKIGFTIGKFAPFHKGHQFLIETGLKEMDKFIVVVYDTDVIDIPTEKRADWIKELYPNVEIKYAHNPPSQYGLDKESVDIQMKYLTQIIGEDKPTHFYSSEKYGASVANYMDIVDRRVDMQRETVPISATKVRNNIEENKKYLENNVYNDIKK
jgi:cytidyltransferase-like protein